MKIEGHANKVLNDHRSNALQMDQIPSTESQRVCTYDPQNSSYIRGWNMHPETEQTYTIHWNNNKWLGAQSQLRRVALKEHGDNMSPHAHQPGGSTAPFPPLRRKSLQSVGGWWTNIECHVWSMCQKIIKWKNLCATKAKTYVYMLIGQVESSQTLKSLPRKMSKMDDFSFVGVNAMLQNQHAQKKK